MPVLETQDAEIYYETDGAGPPALLIAGLASDVASWTPVRAALAAHFSLIMPDNRGAGRTRAKAGLAGLSVESMAGDIIQLADHLGLKGCLILGHSMGAAIAVEAALRRPRLAARLALAGAGLSNPRADAAVASLAALHARLGGGADWYRALFPWLFKPAFFADPAMIEAAVAASLAYPYSSTTEMFAAQAAAVLAYETPLHLPSDPVLVLAGAEDILFTPKDCRAFAARFPNARYEEIVGAAHSLFWDDPGAATDALIRFAAA